MYGNLFDKIVDIENLRYAHRKASKGKSFYKEVQWVNDNENDALRYIQHLLISNTYQTSPYKVECTYKGDKIRTIHKLPYFPDRIVQHAIVNICSPFWIKSLIRDTFQSIPGRGTTDCFRRTRKAIQQYKPLYAIKLDIKKFYPSVKPKYVLMPHVFKIKCKRTFNLLAEIINSLPCLPLGNHTSQYAGNLLLSPIDWFVKQQLRIKFYFRYCDDMIIMHNSIKHLLMVRDRIKNLMEDIDLNIKDIVPVIDLRKQYLDFVGYRINHNKVLLRKRLSNNFKNACKYGKVKSLPSYYGWIKHANTKNLWYKTTRSYKWKLS